MKKKLQKVSCIKLKRFEWNAFAIVEISKVSISRNYHNESSWLCFFFQPTSRKWTWIIAYQFYAMYCVDKLARPFVLLNILFFQFRCCDERHFLYNTIITLHHWPIAISLLMAFRYILLVAYNSTYFIHWIQDHFTAFRKCDYCQSFVWSGAFGVLNVYYVLSSCVQIYIIKQKKNQTIPFIWRGLPSH